MRVSRSYRAVFALSTALALSLFGGRERASAQEGSDRERALVLFEAAELRYQEARFEDAVELLVEARDLYDEAVISYNLGRAYEELGRRAEAAEAFRHYLERAPDARDRRLVEARIERLEGEASEGDEPDEPDELDEPDEPDEPDEADTLDEVAEPEDTGGGGALSLPAVIVSGVGVATLGVGFAFGAASGGARQSAVDDPVHETSRASFRDAESFATVANVMFVLGGAIAAVGLSWLIVDLALGGDDAEVALTIGPGSVAVGGELP